MVCNISISVWKNGKLVKAQIANCKLVSSYTYLPIASFVDLSFAHDGKCTIDEYGIFCDCKRNRIHLFILQNSDFEYFKWESKKACMSGEMVVSYEALLYNQNFEHSSMKKKDDF